MGRGTGNDTQAVRLAAPFRRPITPSKEGQRRYILALKKGKDKRVLDEPGRLSHGLLQQRDLDLDHTLLLEEQIAVKDDKGKLYWSLAKELYTKPAQAKTQWQAQADLSELRKFADELNKEPLGYQVTTSVKDEKLCICLEKRDMRLHNNGTVEIASKPQDERSFALDDADEKVRAAKYYRERLQIADETNRRDLEKRGVKPFNPGLRGDQMNKTKDDLKREKKQANRKSKTAEEIVKDYQQIIREADIVEARKREAEERKRREAQAEAERQARELKEAEERAWQEEQRRKRVHTERQDEFFRSANHPKD